MIFRLLMLLLSVGAGSAGAFCLLIAYSFWGAGAEVIFVIFGVLLLLASYGLVRLATYVPDEES